MDQQPPLRARIPDGYGDTGFQATALIFPTEGCWEVTGEVGDTRLTFLTPVVSSESTIRFRSLAVCECLLLSGIPVDVQTAFAEM
jgi:hypothetical protein